MMRRTGSDNLQKIVILNPKGGSGKTTLSTNLASNLANQQSPPTLIDCDPQGFCTRWLDKRPTERSLIHGIAAPNVYPLDVISSADEVPQESATMIFDLPAAIPNNDLYAYTQVADYLLIPITPSSIDVHAAAQFISELLLDAQLDRREQKIAIVANRVRARTNSFKMLQRFVTSLDIPVISVLRDSQNYVSAAGNGLGVCDLPMHRARDDMESWRPIMSWLDRSNHSIAENENLNIRTSVPQHLVAANNSFQSHSP